MLNNRIPSLFKKYQGSNSRTANILISAREHVLRFCSADYRKQTRVPYTRRWRTLDNQRPDIILVISGSNNETMPCNPQTMEKKSNGYNASAREQFNPGSARLTRLANKFQIPAPSPLPISLDPSNLHLYSMQQSSSSHTDLLEEKGKKERKKEEKKREESLEKISTRIRLKYGAKRVVAVSRRCCWWRSIWRPHCPPSPSPPCTRE